MAIRSPDAQWYRQPVTVPFRLRDVWLRWALEAGLLGAVWWQAPWSVALVLTLLVTRCEIVDSFVFPPPR